jgi:hypothetical protein
MTTHATATFSLKSWDEKTWDGKPYNEVTGAKLTRAEVAYTYQGDLVGDSTLQYLMFYREDGTGHSVALERIAGTLAGRTGSFMLQHSSTFAAHGVEGTFFVIPGSGTGELQGLRGEGKLMVQGQPWSIVFDYAFDGASESP